MRVMVTGAGGQVGRALTASAPASVELFGLRRTELDISDENAVHAAVRRFRPDLVINAAAYTAVDEAERDADSARLVNSEAPRYLAQAVREHASRLLHVSTDYVFDGESSTPYPPDAPTNPINVYGKTKRSGEVAVLDIASARGVVLRTSWVYAATGRNFVQTMLKAMRERPTVRVVADQVGTPTAAHSIGHALWQLAQRPVVSGVHHWTDAGTASWYDFAVAIAEEAAPLGLVPSTVKVEPITSNEYRTLAKRPVYSVLDKSSALAVGLGPAVPWRENLRVVLSELAHA